MPSDTLRCPQTLSDPLRLLQMSADTLRRPQTLSDSLRHPQMLSDAHTLRLPQTSSDTHRATVMDACRALILQSGRWGECIFDTLLTVAISGVAQAWSILTI